ncbi:MAG TPA: GNAT family N-acetyltransferase [Lacipirellulaceae bacterium]|nr:GNAT family N-acetyltransferase [Lacipirellulaceae bacterium]
MPSVAVECWDARTYTSAQAQAIAELLHQVWPKPNGTVADRQRDLLAIGEEQDSPRQSAPRSWVVLDDVRVAAHAMVFGRQIRTTQGDATIAALARVCVDANHRGRGLGELVVRAALATVDAGEFPWALFQTSRRVRPFYERLGAVETLNPIINSCGEPKANPFWDEVVMHYGAADNWPTGTIDLRGPGY